MDKQNIRQFIYQENDILPFISVLSLEQDNNFIGIILNSDKHTISFIDLEKIRSDEDLYDFLEICLDWWWYSNRKIPVNLFDPERCGRFLRYVTYIPQKNTDITRGHVVSMQDIVSGTKSYRRNRSLNIVN